jgi:hypothetical protein
VYVAIAASANSCCCVMNLRMYLATLRAGLYVIAKTAQWQPVNSKTGAYPVQAVASSKSTVTSAAATTATTATNGTTDSAQVSKQP